MAGSPGLLRLCDRRLQAGAYRPELNWRWENGCEESCHVGGPQGRKNEETQQSATDCHCSESGQHKSGESRGPLGGRQESCPLEIQRMTAAGEIVELTRKCGYGGWEGGGAL